MLFTRLATRPLVHLARLAPGAACRPTAPNVHAEVALRQQLGNEHPLTEAVRLYRTLNIGRITAAILLPLALLLSPIAGMATLLVAVGAGLALSVCAVGAAGARKACWERTISLFATGVHPAVPYTNAIAARLTSQSHRRVLANMLTLALRRAEASEHCPVGVRQSQEGAETGRLADEAKPIVAALRSSAPMKIQDAALCERLIRQWFATPPSAGSPPHLHERLARIRYQIS